MKINIEDVRKAKLLIDHINSTSLSRMELFENGKKVEIPKKLIAHFRNNTVSNFTLLHGGFYRWKLFRRD